MTLWKRNVIGAVVAVVALVVFTWIEVRPNWLAYRQTEIPPLVVAADQSGTVGGQTWRVASVRHLGSNPAPSGEPLPKNTVLQVVSIERSGTAPDGLCVGFITDGQHRWRAQSIGAFAVTPPDGATGNCTKSGPVQFSFLLPHDVVPTAVDVTDFNTKIMVRLTL